MSSCLGARLLCPCDNWLGLNNYKPDSFKSKTAWLNEQFNAMLYANKQALKGIHKSTKRNKDHTGGKDLTIPVGNHVLLHVTILRDAIRFRISTSLMFMSWLVIIRNRMFITFNSWIVVNPGQPKVVNWHQLYDLKRSLPPSTSPLGDDGFAIVLSFLNRRSNYSPTLVLLMIHIITHHYSTHSKCKTAATDGSVVVETIVTSFLMADLWCIWVTIL